MTFKILFVIATIIFNTGCLSLMIKKGESQSQSYWEEPKEKNIEHCRQKPTKYIQRLCYANLFEANEDIKVCKGLSENSIAQYVCYFEILKGKNLKRSEVRSFCPDKMCLAVYAYRNYGAIGEQPEFLPYRDRARQIESETSYTLPPVTKPPPTSGLEFHEVLHAELRSNRAFGIGYDLNFKFDGNEIPSIGLGYYNLAEKIFFVDAVVSGVQKPVAARLALGVEFKEDYQSRYHLMYALGLGVKSGGFAPLLEISSDFKKDHQLVFGFMLLFQPARKN